MLVKDLFVPVRHEPRNSAVLYFSVLCENSSFVIGFKRTCAQKSLFSLTQIILQQCQFNVLNNELTTAISACNKAIVGPHIRVTKVTLTAVTRAS